MKIKERERGGMERVKGRVRGREKRRGLGRGRHRETENIKQAGKRW